MSDLGRYIVEEWAEEFRDGRLGRRELLRRISIFTGGAALGVGVLRSLGVAATAEEVAEAASLPAPLTSAAPRAFAPVVPPDDPALDARMVTFPLGTAPVIGYRAQPRSGGRAPGVLVIHENRGLLDHHKDVTRRFAKAGYVAVAPDLASPGGGTGHFSDTAEVTALLGRTPPDQLVAMLNAGVRYLQSLPNVQAQRVGAVGFCFGGGMAWRLATANADLKAVAPFYGPNPPLEDVPKIRAAILALYGALDERIDAGIPAIRQALEANKIVHEIIVYSGANHAFFNDTGPNYNAQAAQDAWTRVAAWFTQYLRA
jgi:carboxymethylenebutenolidase